MIDISAFIAVFIGGPGVSAFSVFYTTNKGKEVALRKINGATAWEIQELLNKEFIRLTAYACITGFSLAYYIPNLWLEKFAYKTTLNWYFFLLSAAICLFFVLLTTIW